MKALMNLLVAPLTANNEKLTLGKFLALFKLKADSPISIQIIYPISAFVLSLFSNKKWPQSCQFATYRRNGLFEFSTSQTGQMAFPIFKVIMS